ncbi:PREDICTED: probable phospholipid-transporting ATPase VA [Chrysochloris asiatica]|uniref:Phospholipid-transporting ATPase n=1 Tax=Chrysochloris asiatica TaxID=185453 RepID=A0A9B0TIH4_CHRAS|nr:PREDICTED: probable phospholipid-transporting ATPase VA [Chrysochloris asiatica]
MRAQRHAAMERERAEVEEHREKAPQLRRRRRRRRREGLTRRVRSNLLQPPSAEEFAAGAAKGSQHLADNRLKTTKYTLLSFLPKNLFEQFHRLANVYFVFIALLNFVPAVNAFQPGLALAPVLFILAVTAFKDLWEDYSRHLSDHEINHLGCLVYSREEKRYMNRYWKELHVGDFVRLRCNEIIPADVLLLSSSNPDGLCHIETANLDGETNLKRRQVVRGFSEVVSEFNPLMFTSIIECEKPNNDLTKFRGCIIHENGEKAALHKENLLLRGCTIRNTEAVVGIVIYAGHETKALLNNNGPRYKRSQLERQMNCDVLWCVFILVCMSLISAIGHGLWVWRYQEKKSLFDVPESDGKALSPILAAVYSFLTMIIVLQVLIPISLYVSIEIVKVCQVYFINQDIELYDEETDSQLQCRALNITEDLGQIQYIFSDKTGTLTENKMVFRKCTVSGIEYSHDANTQRLAMYQEADSEEEEVVPRSASLSLHSSIGGHQSMRVPHRVQSTRSHRRTGSWAEAKRANVLSRHTAFSSPMEKDIIPDPKLFEKVSKCDQYLATARHQEHLLTQLPPELSDVFDFFIALTICNTVLVTSPDQPRQKVSVQLELKSPVKTIEDFLRRFTPSRLALGCSSIGNLPTSRSANKSDSNFMSSLSSDSALLQLEQRLGPPGPDVTGNGIRSQAAASWALGCQEERELRYEAESPDEAALVYAARAYNCALVDRLPDQVCVELPHLGRLTFELLHTLSFDSIRKRMSVVIRHPLTDEINVYTKGADSAVMDLLIPCTSDDARGRHQKKIQSRTQKYLNLYAVEGLRTLCIAKRVLSKEEYACWLQRHMEAESSLDNREELLFQSALRLETNLHLLGATGIEDRLQEGVPETIAKLRQAGLQIWVLTGDKQETAVNIAYACKLLDQDEEVITFNAESQEACAALLNQCLQYVQSRDSGSTPEKISGNVSETFSPLCQLSVPPTSGPRPSLVIDGRSLAYALEKSLEDKFLFLAKQCRSVLCCRSTPLQKSMMVKLVRSKLKAMTLAIGDGANDVSMLQVADVGVGIAGQEGMQVVMASDFAVPRFRYLERLLIVHGHWCYSRIANMVLYFFYKNTMFVGLLFWFQFYCGFSASAMIDQWYLIFFNLLFSSLPQLVTGVLDKDVPAHVLLAEPQLYKSGQNREEYRPRAFWINMADATFQSLVCFFIPYWAYFDSDADMFTWGTPITTVALLTFLLHLSIETKTWTWFNWIACGFSILLFFIVALIYNASCATCYPPSNPYWTMQTLMGDPVFYLTCFIAPVAALLPRLFFKALQGTLCPTQLHLGRQLAKRYPKKPNTPKDAFVQEQLPVEPRNSSSSQALCQNDDPQTSASLEEVPVQENPSVVSANMLPKTLPSQEYSLLEGLNSQAPGSSTPKEVAQDVCTQDPKIKQTSAVGAAPLPSIFKLPNLSSLNWISSLSLVSELGSVLQFSQSTSQVDKENGEFRPRPSQPTEDLKSLREQTAKSV